MSGSRRRAALVGALVVVLGWAGIAAAHSGLGAASPAPGAIVGGEITDIQLRYASTVTDVTGSVTDPAGADVETEFVQDSALAVTIRLASPLTVPGEYAVRHSSTSVDDGDRVDAAYLFTYEPSAPPPQLEILALDDEAGTSIWVWIVSAAGAVLIVALATRLVRATRAGRARAACG